VIIEILKVGLLPTFYNPNPTTAETIVNACISGGAKAVEFTNRGALAHKVFTKLAESNDRGFTKGFLGVGTIIDPATASLYINIGAKFIVGPAFNTEVAKICNRRKVPYIPGCSTCSEISKAEEMGADIVKVFPAKVLGPYFIKALLAPCPWFRLMPSGGVEATRESVFSWIGSGAAALNIGGSLISTELVESGDFEGIEKKVQDTIRWIESAREVDD